MKNIKCLLVLFLAISLAQIAAPLYMAWHWENILLTGQTFYWQTAPVDPYDAFKGRYIDLRFKEMSAPSLDSTEFNYGQTAYALLGVNQEGQAYIRGIAHLQPAETPFIRVKINYIQDNQVHVELPFRRYYLPENQATAAETAYQKKAGQTAVAAVRLKDGYGVIEQLYIDNKTLTDYLLEATPPSKE
ncbi:GDYXXLXY domain-containing protein [bacterium BFN5]|nr:GDYXXLXY domain-containing protein [bacterium BFN5]QJW45633.1 GDYXXLXY domain-containing protein [bacterium BFN5]